MTTTERDWTGDDPYAGQKLPEPPAWLPGAGDAIFAPVGATAAEEPRTGDAPAPPSAVAQPAASVPDLTKRQPKPPAPGVATDPDTADSEDDADSWAYVPLDVADDEAPPQREPHYVNPEIVEPPAPVAEPLDTAPGLPGQHWFDEGPKDRPWHLIALAGALVVVIVVSAVIFLAGGDGGKDKTTARLPPASSLPPQAMPSEAVAARPVPADRLDALRPQAVAVGVFDGRLQVTWDPPRSPEDVSGYFVIAQTPGTGQVEQRRLIERDGDLTAILDDTDVCVVVTTVVSSPEGLQLARGDLVCPAAPSKRPTS
ncbi:hypothetical protein LO772_18865 [Yinghuangia sp. ASG 101]|uniref:hypothetical protein n=1 Tax=Yinghuangia sp. ASG 101 TaxID=2896848 RepID=UPI001E454F31|nr:hypothetical protein [Yinghuangia sp. ASG 101]UGQ09033.1 hypothetical protein LO772_18865 [Yinghuangia sp. ASG 101]